MNPGIESTPNRSFRRGATFMMQVAGFALLGMGVSEMQEEIEKGPRFIERHGRIVEDYDQGEEVLTAVAGIILAASGSRLADKARE